ncbi:MAG TPA: LysR family transcriptional regulator, partial [Clostridiales bacterium]|nr:LysR family transcriptional regulator [Clostridiales bacterium]
MNIYNLKYFIALANDLSFTKASEKLYISQQALSKHIRCLEDEYDT